MFTHRQFAIANPLSWVVFPVAGYMWYEMGVLVVTGAPSPPSPGNLAISPPALLALFLISGVALPVFVALMHLVIRVDQTHVHVRFWPFSRDTIARDSIQSVEAITYKPLTDCLGWGVRRYRTGKALTVAGDRGVLVTYADDAGKPKTLLLGAPDAEGLARAISGD